ncbi:ABC transporter substrate-binding protein [Natronorubrum sp. FCH18a]|uniref:ABC transporter substrate-binding protein n=1 Tax=Natronorubrum sp. FCH18a TaxID=3447018 RepID=UPI003F510B0F
MTSVNRRTALGIITTGVGTGIAGCLGGNSDQLIHLGFGGTLQEAREEVAEAWTEQSDIEVVHESAAEAEEYMTMIEQNPETYDVVTSNDEFFHRAGEEGLLQSIDLDQTPNFEENTYDDTRNQDAMPFAFNDDGEIHMLLRETVTTGFAYNSELAEEEHTSWDALLRDEYNGYVSLLNRPHYRYTNAALALGLDFYEALEDDNQMQEIEELLVEQNNQTFNYFEAADTMMRQLQNEEAHISEAWGGRVFSLINEGHDHIEYVIPDEGCVVGVDGTGIPANADEDNLEHIYDYLNFQYQEESLETYPQHTNYAPPMADPPEAVTDLPGWTDSLSDFAFTDYEALDPHHEDIIERLELIRSGDYEP